MANKETLYKYLDWPLEMLVDRIEEQQDIIDQQKDVIKSYREEVEVMYERWKEEWYDKWYEDARKEFDE